MGMAVIAGRRRDAAIHDHQRAAGKGEEGLALTNKTEAHLADLIGTPSGIPSILLRTVIVYVFILVGFSLSGKREVGQLAPYDFALILLIANIRSKKKAAV